jgi:hypothetical protein
MILGLEGSYADALEAEDELDALASIDVGESRSVQLTSSSPSGLGLKWARLTSGFVEKKDGVYEWSLMMDEWWL